MKTWWIICAAVQVVLSLAQIAAGDKQMAIFAALCVFIFIALAEIEEIKERLPSKEEEK